MKPRTLHWAWYWLVILVALCGVTAVSAAQTPPPINHIGVTADARHVLDSLAHDARTHRVENGACVVAYHVTDSTLVLDRLAGAIYESADSISIRANGAICHPGVPTIHSHVSFDGWPYPSGVDSATAKVRGTWNLILSVHDVGYFLVLY